MMFFYFFFNDTATTEIYTLSLHDALPIFPMMVMGATDGLYLRAIGIPTYGVQGFLMDRDDLRFHGRDERSEEHTSELQSRLHLVCRLLPEKKNDVMSMRQQQSRATPCSPH